VLYREILNDAGTIRNTEKHFVEKKRRDLRAEPGGTYSNH
jgi:hypothetical protein